jgi:hypothetical protein
MRGRSNSISVRSTRSDDGQQRCGVSLDFGSPNAYLSRLVIPGIERRTVATFDYVRVLLGGYSS